MRACTKRAYASKKDALTVRNQVIHGKRRKHRPDALKAYACPICPNGTWHLSSK